MEAHVNIEFRVSTAEPWRHGKSVPAWAMKDREHARIQRAHVRSLVRADHGADSPVLLRVTDDDGNVIA